MDTVIASGIMRILQIKENNEMLILDKSFSNKCLKAHKIIKSNTVV